MNRRKRAELTSGVGALVLGLGLGVLFSRWLAPAAGLITVIGLCMHAFGMWDMHRLDARDQVESPPWTAALYWLCWISLAAVIAVLLVWRR